MSKATKRKHVTREVLEEFVVPTVDQKIVKVLCGRGNNLHGVEAPSGEQFLVSMPTKFRRNVWIKRGDYVIVDPIAEGNKVQAEIVHILYPLQIKHLKEEKLWPAEFEDRKADKAATVTTSSLSSHNAAATATQNKHPSKDVVNQDPFEGSSEESEDDSDLFVNTNRPPPIEYDTTSSSSDGESET